MLTSLTTKLDVVITSHRFLSITMDIIKLFAFENDSWKTLATLKSSWMIYRALKDEPNIFYAISDKHKTIINAPDVYFRNAHQYLTKEDALVYQMSRIMFLLGPLSTRLLRYINK